MADATHADMPKMSGISGLVEWANSLLASIPQSLALLVLRVALAVPFLKSGWLKWDGFLTLSMGAQYVFQEEFRLHIFGSQFAYPFPLTVAFLAGLAEIILPLLLILGLGTRFAAFGLLIMTGVIQLTSATSVDPPPFSPSSHASGMLPSIRTSISFSESGRFERRSASLFC